MGAKEHRAPFRIEKIILASCLALGVLLALQQLTFAAWEPVAVYDDGYTHFEVQRIYDWPLTIIAIMTVGITWTALFLEDRARLLTLGIAFVGLLVFGFGLWIYPDSPSSGGLFGEIAAVRPRQYAGAAYGDSEVLQQSPLLWQMRYDPGFIISLVIALGLLIVGIQALEKAVADFQSARDAANTCKRCGYNLTGNVSGRCPECGREIRPHT